MKKILSILFLSLLLVGTAATPLVADDDPPACPPNAPNCRPPLPPQ
ncbi:MAG: hypothetical protein ACRD2Q_02790 [Terriglobales bacterium]